METSFWNGKIAESLRLLDFETVRSFHWKHTNLELKVYDPEYLFISHHEAEFIRSLTESFSHSFFEWSFQSMVCSKLSYPNWDNFHFRNRVYSKLGLVLVPYKGKGWLSCKIYHHKNVNDHKKLRIFHENFSYSKRLSLKAYGPWPGLLVQ